MKTFKVIALCFFVTTAQAFTWPTGTPTEVGLDATYIDSAIAEITANNVGQIRSLLIIKDGKLVTERYFGNQGEKRPVYSVTKSIGSVLLGVAKYQGADLQLTTPISQYLPQYNNIQNIGQVNNITLHDLLTQRHGYAWDEWTLPYSSFNNPVSQMLRTSDWYLTAVQWPINELPDQNFTYSTGHSSLMSPILENRTGRDVYEFTASELFVPLGITDTHWELITGGGTQGQGISNFPAGIEPLGFGLWLKPYDMAKIGALYLNQGLWEGQRLLSADWVNSSTQLYSNGDSDSDVFNDAFAGYGYQWWLLRMVDSMGRDFDMYYADGYGRQYIFVIPDSNTVVVSTADDYAYNGPGMGTLLREHILLAFAQGEDEFIDITTDMNGSWYWPENAGQGVNLEILNHGQTLAGYWYTYDVTGGNQRWFTFQGDIDGDQATFTLYATTGGGFVESDPPEVIVWGQGSLRIRDCFSGEFSYESSLEAVSGTIPLTRLSASTGVCVGTGKTIEYNKNLK